MPKNQSIGKALYILTFQHWIPEQKEWKSWGSDLNTKIATPSELTLYIKSRLRTERDNDPSFGGLIAAKKTKHRCRVRKVYVLEDYITD